MDEKSMGLVSGFKHDNRLKCHRGIVSQWTFQVGLNVTGRNVGGRNVKAPKILLGIKQSQTHQRRINLVFQCCIIHIWCEEWNIFSYLRYVHQSNVIIS